MVEKKAKFTRSPRYPVYSLPRALEKLNTLHSEHKKYLVAVTAALQAMGHKAGSSKGLQVLAALGYYGLIDTEGIGEKKRVKVSDLAFNIIMDKRPGSKERAEAIREAALYPKIFKKLYSQYPDSLPGDSALQYDLTVKYGFNEQSVHDFLKTFKETMNFAKIYESDKIEEETEEMEDSLFLEEGDKEVISTDTQKTMKGKSFAFFPISPHLSFQINVIKEEDAEVTQGDINKLLVYLKVYKGDFPQGERIDNQIYESSED